MQGPTVQRTPDTGARIGRSTPWRCPRGAACASTGRHDDLYGYRDLCRSGAARRGNADYQAQKRAGRTRWNVPGIGTARRLQALHAMGWSDPVLARRIGTTASHAHRLRTGRRQVYTSTAAAVAWLYLELSETPGPSERARRSAAALGEAPPAAWDPDTDAIDDPAAKPWTERRIDAVRRERRERRERVAELTPWRTAEEIAEALRVTPRTVERIRAELAEAA
jgi:hypothetical protein